MAVVAVIAARNVCRVLAGRRHAIVTGAAGTNDLGVVNRVRGHEYTGVVAVFADGSRLDVRRVLADRIRAVVATAAVIRDIYVIEIRR